MQNKSKLNTILLFIIIVLLVIGLVYIYSKKKEITPEAPLPNPVSTWGGSDKFVFIKDYKVEQPKYNGGDFPSGTETTIFKKGDIIEGKYGIVGCDGAGCIPPEVVRVVINGQNLAIDKTILVPYK